MACSTVCGSPRTVTVRMASSGLSGSSAANTRAHPCLPPAHHLATCRRRVQFELLITLAVGLFTVAGEEVREARAHIARQMLDQCGHGVRRWINGDEKIFVGKLRHGSFAQALVTTQLAAGFIQIMRCCV